MWYCWIALINEKVWWNTDEYTVSFLYSDRLYFLRHHIKIYIYWMGRKCCHLFFSVLPRDHQIIGFFMDEYSVSFNEVKRPWSERHIPCLAYYFKPWRSLHKSGFKWISSSESLPCKSSARHNFHWYTVMMPQYPPLLKTCLEIQRNVFLEGTNQTSTGDINTFPNAISFFVRAGQLTFVSVDCPWYCIYLCMTQSCV